MEQITQGLRAAILEQSQQGMTVSQMMSSGISFADIIMTIIGNQQENAEGMVFPEMSLPGMIDSEMQSAQQVNVQGEFGDILGLMTPDIMNGIQNSGFLSEGFITDDNLFKKLSNNEEYQSIFGKVNTYETFNLKDSDEHLSYSGSIVKADPLQLAGLLDYIGTGIGIPSAADILDNEVLVSNKSVNSDSIKNLTGALSSTESFKNQFDPEQMIKSGEMEIISYVPEVPKNTETESVSDSSETDALEFYRTMNSVKENVKTEESKSAGVSENTVSFNVDDMNKYAENIDISFDRAAAETTMNKLEYEPAERQLLRGISENLEKEKSEFTVKLKPDGLGEILVKLVQNNEGKMLLTMIASSAKTAELLNHDLASLQSSLNQHNVEIVNKSVDVAKNVMPMTSAFDQYDERRQDEGRQQNQFRSLKSKINSTPIKNVLFDTEIISGQNIISDQALDITI